MGIKCFNKATIISNFRYKVVALLLASALWVLVHQDDLSRKILSVSVIIEVPAGYGIKGGHRLKKQALFVGSKEVLENLTETSIEAFIKISTPKKGVLKVSLVKKHLQIQDKGFEVFIQDPEFEVFIDRIVEKVFPVKVSLVGALKPGFHLKKISLKPQNVLATGLEEDLLAVTAVHTEVVNISGFSRDVVLYSGLRLPENSKVEWGQRRVKVSLSIAPIDETIK